MPDYWFVKSVDLIRQTTWLATLRIWRQCLKSFVKLLAITLGQHLLSSIPTPTKQSNAQHLVEYEKQLLYEENKKSGKFMQHPKDSYVCGINTSSESILIRSYLVFVR